MLIHCEGWSSHVIWRHTYVRRSLSWLLHIGGSEGSGERIIVIGRWRIGGWWYSQTSRNSTSLVQMAVSGAGGNWGRAVTPDLPRRRWSTVVGVSWYGGVSLLVASGNSSGSTASWIGSFTAISSPNPSLAPSTNLISTAAPSIFNKMATESTLLLTQWVGLTIEALTCLAGALIHPIWTSSRIFGIIWTAWYTLETHFPGISMSFGKLWRRSGRT